MRYYSSVTSLNTHERRDRITLTGTIVVFERYTCKIGEGFRHIYSATRGLTGSGAFLSDQM